MKKLIALLVVIFFLGACAGPKKYGSSKIPYRKCQTEKPTYK